MSQRRIIGNDGKLMNITFGPTLTTAVPALSWVKVIAKATSVWGATEIGGTGTIPAGTWVKIITKDAVSSAFGTKAIGSTFYSVGAMSPTDTDDTWQEATTHSAFGELEVGEFFYNAQASTKAVISGDSWQLVTPTDMVDLSGWSLELTKSEIDVTVLADSTKKYRAGKSDAQGSAKFIFIKDVTDMEGGLANYFYKIATISSTGIAETSPLLTSDPYLLVYIDNTDTASGEYRLAMFIQVAFLGFPITAEDDTALSVESNFRLSGSLNPTIYRIQNA